MPKRNTVPISSHSLFLQVVGWIVSPKRHVQVLTPRSYECDLIGNRVFADVVKLRWGHFGLRWALNPAWLGDLIRRGKLWRRATSTWEESMWRQRQRLVGCFCEPRKAKDCRQPEARWGEEGFFCRCLGPFIPRSFGGSMACDNTD